MNTTTLRRRHCAQLYNFQMLQNTAFCATQGCNPSSALLCKPRFSKRPPLLTKHGFLGAAVALVPFAVPFTKGERGRGRGVGLQAALLGVMHTKMEKTAAPGRWKEPKTRLHSKTVLSGEVFKESFTDIFQTSLEQVAFSLPSPTVTGAIRSVGTDNPFPPSPFPSPLTKLCFVTRTVTKQSFVRGEGKGEGVQGKMNWYKRGLSADKTIRGQRFRNRAVLCQGTLATGGSPKLSGLLGGGKALLRRVPRRFCSQTRFAEQENPISLDVKIGDYLASGDKIGERQRTLLYGSCARRHVRQRLQNMLQAKQVFGALRVPHPCSQKTRAGLLHRLTPILARNGVVRGKHRSSLFKRGHRTSLKKRGHRTSLKKRGHRTSLKKRGVVLSSSGRVLTISKTQLVIQKVQPILFYNSANLHVKKGEWVQEGSPILTLTHQTLITGDIVQGIPRIEQLFEAFTSPPVASNLKEKRTATRFKDVYDTLHSQLRDIFRKHWRKERLPIAVRKSLEEIQYSLVEMIQKVYLSQGVLIADKHIEIVVRQIASKGQILDSGTTGLFLEEVLPIRQIENANLTTQGKKCLYVPAVMGLTAAALNSDSFVSAASFQETTRVLSRDAVVGKSDFLRGLKEKVVIGDLISAGTGLDIYFIYTTIA